MAGGTPQASFNAAEYTTTKFAKQGDYGTVVLKPRPTGTVWKRGATAAVRMQLTANHGGGCERPPLCAQLSASLASPQAVALDGDDSLLSEHCVPHPQRIVTGGVSSIVRTSVSRRPIPSVSCGP